MFMVGQTKAQRTSSFVEQRKKQGKRGNQWKN